MGGEDNIPFLPFFYYNLFNKKDDRKEIYEYG